MLKTGRIGNQEAGNMKHWVFVVSFLIIWMSSSCISKSVAGVIPNCPMCGNTSVPYPFSTQDGCGVSDYRIYCNAANDLEFKSVNGSSYKIISINPATMRLVIQPSPLINDSCQTQDMSNQGLQLNQSLPFNITSTNTIMLLNCDPIILTSPLNCSSASSCHTYVNESEAAMACRNDSICCTFTAGSSTTAHRIRVHPGGCRAYTSVLNFNPALPASRWSYGVEIQWAAPLEPSCKTQADCDQNSACSPDPMDSGSPRCLCIGDYIWDPVQGNCTKNVSVCIDPNGCGNSNRGALIGGLVAGMCVAIAVAVLAIIMYRRKRLQMQTQARLMKERADILSTNSGSAELFTSKEMKRATNGFAKDRILGIGGFGEVYKGILKDGTVVAVKTAKVGNIKGIEQVLNEVRILSQVNHRNLVRLLGCCVDAEEPLLVYEYIPNGTLFDHLHMISEGKFLEWRTRLNIALHTGEALAYLHSAAFPPIYHRDVKSTNILLDSNLNAKVSDFGLSRLAETDLSHISTCAQGTLGYLDPEYYRNYQLTDKSDVYSFGVVLLELVTSQKAIDFSRDPDDVNLVIYVLGRSEQGRIMDVVDSRLKENASQVVLETMKAVAFLALSCLQEKRQDRPTMKEVTEELHYIMSIETSGVVPQDRASTTPQKRNEESGPLLGFQSSRSSHLV